MSADFETIGMRIQKLRHTKEQDEGKHFTQEDLGKALGVTQNTVQKWESGAVKLNSEKIIELADFFGVSCDWLLKGGKTENLAFINETGLHDDTVELLKFYKRNNNPHIASVVDCIIQNSFLCSALYAYFHCDFKNLIAEGPGPDHELITISTKRFTFDSDDGIYATIGLDDFEVLARDAIMKGLARIRTEYKNAESEKSK